MHLRKQNDHLRAKLELELELEIECAYFDLIDRRMQKFHGISI